MVFLNLILVTLFLKITEQTRNYVQNPTFKPINYLKRGLYAQTFVEPWIAKTSCFLFISTWKEEDCIYLKPETNLLKIFLDHKIVYVQKIILEKGKYSLSAYILGINIKTKEELEFKFCEQEVSLIIHKRRKETPKTPEKREIMNLIINEKTVCYLSIEAYEIHLENKAELLISNIQLKKNWFETFLR